MSNARTRGNHPQQQAVTLHLHHTLPSRIIHSPTSYTPYLSLLNTNLTSLQTYAEQCYLERDRETWEVTMGIVEDVKRAVEVYEGLSSCDAAAADAAANAPAHAASNATTRATTSAGDQTLSPPPSHPPSLPPTKPFYQVPHNKQIYLHGFTHSQLLHSSSSTAAPLPETVTGVIQSTQTVHLVPSVRTNYPFLKHLPDYLHVTLVQIDVNAYLDKATIEHFKPSVRARLKAMKDKAVNEKKLLKAINNKQRPTSYNLVYEDAVYDAMSKPQIDYNDDFFMSSTAGNHDDTMTPIQESIAHLDLNDDDKALFSYKNVTENMGAFPGLNGDNAFPELGGGVKKMKAGDGGVPDFIDKQSCGAVAASQLPPPPPPPQASPPAASAAEAVAAPGKKTKKLKFKPLKL
jgi:hypothetical protein